MGSRVVVTALAFGLAVVGVIAGGCEAIVPADLPAYACSGSSPVECPVGMTCVNGSCMFCSGPACSGGGDANIESGADANPTDTGRPDVPLTDGPVDAVTDGPPPVDAPPDTPPPPPDGGKGGVGAACTAPTDCQSGICGDATVLGSTVTTTLGSSVCTLGCCTAADCPANYVCYGAGTGGNYCVVSTALGRPASVGANLPGAACPGGDGDCRSGKCVAGACVDTCCSDASCTNGTVCTADTAGLDGHQVFACLSHSGTAPKSTCSTGSTCQSGFCETIDHTCRPHCCGTASCAGAGYHACESDTLGSDLTFVCTYPSGPPPGAAFAQPCTDDTQCVSRACDGYTSRCSEHCCTDADCASLGNYVCKPEPTAPRVMVCTAP